MNTVFFKVRPAWALLAACLFASWLTTLRAVAEAPSPASEQAPRLTKAPALLKFVEATYPAVEPKHAGDVGVGMLLLLDAEGKVAEVEVKESAGAAFDAAAVEAARAFVFSPAEIDDEPAPIRIEYRYVFTQRVEVALPVVGALSGTVLDADRKVALPNVMIALASGQSALTDAEGKFRIADVPPGVVVLTLSGERLTPLQTEETIVAGEELEVSYKVALQAEVQAGGSGDDLEILVTAPPALQRDVVSTKITAKQAQSVPGAQGDVVRVVENLPGVARSAVGSGQLVVWGAGPEDTRTYVDGVPIPRLYHEGGLRSTVYAGVVSSVELVPGGYGSAFGRGLGGLVRVDSDTPDHNGVHGRVAADVLDASGMLSTSLGAHTNAAVTARLSLIDQIAKGLDDDVSEYVPIPRYRDGQLRLSHQLRQGERVELVGMLSTDHTARGVPNPDPALITREARDLAFYRLYARYVNEHGRGTRSSVTPYIGFGSAELKSSYGQTVTSVSSDDRLVGLRAHHAAGIARYLSVEGGIDLEFSSTTVARNGSLGLPAREGDVRVFGQPPPDRIGSDRTKVTTLGVAPYVAADLALFSDKLHIVPGLRVDPLFRSVSRKVPQESDNPPIGLFEANFVIEPRLALRGAIGERLTLHAATGIYHQQPSAQDLSATFGNPALAPSRAVHFVSGAGVKAADDLTIELTGFLTRSEDLAMRNGQDAPLRAQALLATGEGRSYGVQALVRKELSHGVFGWVAYTLMRSERKNDADSAWRLFDYDQTHVLSTVLVWSPLKGFEVGSRFRVASGFPRTRVTSSYYDAKRDRVQPVFGEQNGYRMPLFVQLDLRVSQAFLLGGTELQAYLEVQNVSNRDNTEEVVYSPDFSEQGKIQSLPILPVAGLQWTF